MLSNDIKDSLVGVKTKSDRIMRVKSVADRDQGYQGLSTGQIFDPK